MARLENKIAKVLLTGSFLSGIGAMAGLYGAITTPKNEISLYAGLSAFMLGITGLSCLANSYKKIKRNEIKDGYFCKN